MIKRIWEFYLSPKMGGVIYASFLWGLFPAGAAQGTAWVLWVLCMDLAAIRSVLLLCMKDRQQMPHWKRGFWIGWGWMILFLIQLLLFGDAAFIWWTYPVQAWGDLEKLMFVR